MHKAVAGIMEFHISRRARDRYQFDQSLFSLSGNVIFANFHAARLFAQKMNQKRDLVSFPEQAIKAGQVNAMGLIDEILHFVVGIYRRQKNPQVMNEALNWLDEKLGKEGINSALQRFTDEFPPLAVYRRGIPLDEYIESATEGIPNRQILLEEMLFLWLVNANPAFSPYFELFADDSLEKETIYLQIITQLRAFFNTQPKFGPDSQNLIDMLRSPALAVPHSLSGQLEFMRQRWSFLLGEYLFRLLRSLDLISEEEKAIFPGSGPARIYEFAGLEIESERFSPDRDWMPAVVILAKNAFVWLDQLSTHYQREISRLDQVPDEELDKLVRWGFTGLWLIGLWERSAASKRIKQLRGNPDAVASAYSLFDYQIAEDLGGEEAYSNLRRRTWQRGIRLASDMVPNHMGIDSRWVIEHPDRFIALDYSPFPSYSFNGPNLSWENGVGIYLEDHYYDGTDAAVVFKRVDHKAGGVSYIYHGNDGTSMPWNDTAQLNYLSPDVREAVIQAILFVARKFPIIRFDAAMTLAKKHYQRLWFPEPGIGGAIPTRSEHGLTKEQFNLAFPVEFWREVVDRVAQEIPDTLLLAEAFWLMEGYFVRTLGMHRVYNSAFMNMLRDEKNQEYRLVIKNTLEFDPEILKRYVNFMNNPDERTAVDQFGEGDKYFGICTMMATMPGLPMFGHGQIEGFTEKYGMEFRRAYWNELPDEYLVQRHEREIFPLLRRRYLFAEVGNFLLYDFFTSEGFVNEDVFAYSNRVGEERTLVVYHNRYNDTRGWIRNSAAHSVKIGEGEGRKLIQKTLGDGLGLNNQDGFFTIFRDHVTGLEYIRENRQIYAHGLFAEMGAYKCHVFLDFREVLDNEWSHYAQLTAYLDGRGVPNIEEALKELFLQPVHNAYRELVNPGNFRWLIDNRLLPTDGKIDERLLTEVQQKIYNLLQEVNSLVQAGKGETALAEIARDMRRRVQTILELPMLAARSTGSGSTEYRVVVQQLLSELGLDETLEKNKPSPTGLASWGALLGWACTSKLGQILDMDGSPALSRTWLDELLLGKILSRTLRDVGLDEGAVWWALGVVKITINQQDWYKAYNPGSLAAATILQSWLEEGDIQQFLQINRHQGKLWFNKESYEQLLNWMLILPVIEVHADPTAETVQIIEQIMSHYKIIRQLREAKAKSDYQVETLIEAVKGSEAKLI